MSKTLDWNVEGRSFPHREASTFVAASGLTWHVQKMGSGPAIVLLHGTGASAHSWRDIMPLLADDFTIIAPDLPGNGFTRGRIPGGVSLPNVANAVRQLLETLEVRPSLVVGHSSGAAIAMQLSLDGLQVPIVGFSPALMPFPGLAAQLFPALAKLLFINPFAPRIFSRMVRGRGETKKFLYRATNSQIDAAAMRCYEILLGNSRHCEGALAMMASWDLTGFSQRLPRFPTPVMLVHGSRDNAVPLSSVEKACALLPDCELHILEGLGHLAHEERPDEAAQHIRQFASRHAIRDPGCEATRD